MTINPYADIKGLIMKKFILLLVFTGYIYGQVTPFLANLTASLPGVRDVAISKKGDEIYFSLQSYQQEFTTLVFTTQKDGKWQNVQIAPFSGQFQDLEPFFSHNDLRLYFVSNRPISADSSAVKDFDIWYVERKSLQDSWSSAINIGPPVNSEHNEFYPSLAANGNLYFTGDSPLSKGKDDLFVSFFKKGAYADPVSVSDSINSAGYEFNAYIAPDESFLIFTGYNYKDGLGSGDLYISYNSDGKWSAPENLGTEINTDKMEYCPYVDLTTNTLYFTSRRNSVKTVYENKVSLDSIIRDMNRHENGLSRLYKTPFKKSVP